MDKYIEISEAIRSVIYETHKLPDSQGKICLLRLLEEVEDTVEVMLAHANAE